MNYKFRLFLTLIFLMLPVLNLREEYQFAWEDDSIDFYYTDEEGKVYNFNYMVDGVEKAVDLSLLYTLAKSGEPIVLTEEK